ncbi:acetyltransferase [Allorhodopirellula solitaria]|uniref:Acetyltransferase n=1 Tax=Allorhodopirellula solitaria TaxID=2527987 RepID=A0A5C5XT45_9BACT|nr:acetyltransferase [Allorhodopirellula solitaria]TWT66426.1 hypothetical protein CA85_25200 [Allorhodopirellula solitaria]
MFMKESASDDLIKIDDVKQLSSPQESCVKGRRQAGEEEQDPRSFEKTELKFPSGEPLPQCWLDADYELK